MGIIDKTLTAKETRRTQRQHVEDNRLQQAQREEKLMNETLALTASEDSTDE